MIHKIIAIDDLIDMVVSYIQDIDKFRFSLSTKQMYDRLPNLTLTDVYKFEDLMAGGLFMKLFKTVSDKSLENELDKDSCEDVKFLNVSCNDWKSKLVASNLNYEDVDELFMCPSKTDYKIVDNVVCYSRYYRHSLLKYLISKQIVPKIERLCVGAYTKWSDALFHLFVKYQPEYIKHVTHLSLKYYDKIGMKELNMNNFVSLRILYAPSYTNTRNRTGSPLEKYEFECKHLEELVLNQCHITTNLKILPLVRKMTLKWNTVEKGRPFWCSINGCVNWSNLEELSLVAYPIMPFDHESDHVAVPANVTKLHIESIVYVPSEEEKASMYQLPQTYWEKYPTESFYSNITTFDKLLTLNTIQLHDTITELSLDFDLICPVQNLPNSITKLLIKTKSDKWLQYLVDRLPCPEGRVMQSPTALPDALVDLILINRSDKTININKLPQINRLRIDGKFKFCLDKVHASVMVIVGDFNDELKFEAPRLETLIIKGAFDKSLNEIKCPVLKMVEINSNFNMSLNGLLRHDSIEKVFIDGVFNKKIKYFPRNLHRLVLPFAYDRDRTNSFPPVPSMLRITYGVDIVQDQRKFIKPCSYDKIDLSNYGLEWADNIGSDGVVLGQERFHQLQIIARNYNAVRIGRFNLYPYSFQSVL